MPYVVMTANAKMPSSVKSPYRKVYVAKLSREAFAEYFKDGTLPRAITAKAVEEVAWSSGPQNVGRTERSAYHRALREAEALAQKLNLGVEAKARVREAYPPE